MCLTDLKEGFDSLSGDKDEESVERRLEEAKARLPLRFGKEAERLRHYGDVKEFGSENEKEKADEEMSKHFGQNEDRKLEGIWGIILTRKRGLIFQNFIYKNKGFLRSKKL